MSRRPQPRRRPVAAPPRAPLPPRLLAALRASVAPDLPPDVTRCPHCGTPYPAAEECPDPHLPPLAPRPDLIPLPLGPIPPTLGPKRPTGSRPKPPVEDIEPNPEADE